MSWQPIESAPKDGTEILIVQGKYVMAAYWSPDSIKFPWVFLDHTCGLNGMMDGPDGPDSWQPLPDPPATDEGR